jgi:hypothetical protein
VYDWCRLGPWSALALAAVALVPATKRMISWLPNHSDSMEQTTFLEELVVAELFKIFLTFYETET